MKRRDGVQNDNEVMSHTNSLHGSLLKMSAPPIWLAVELDSSDPAMVDEKHECMK